MTPQQPDHNSDSASPRLAPPGAGIQWHQMLMLRHVVGPLVAARSDWDDNRALFHKLNGKVLDAVSSFDETQVQTRVLVPRLQGLEDSSRFWSAAMTLEHLVIVGTGIRGIIKSLAGGIVPPVKVDTATVKPLGHADPQEQIRLFRAFCHDTYADLDASVVLPVSRDVKIDHPWFGPFDALQWQWLLSVHTGIHLKQVREIAKRLT